jgi:hypothetical protein
MIGDYFLAQIENIDRSSFSISLKTGETAFKIIWHEVDMFVERVTEYV